MGIRRRLFLTQATCLGIVTAGAIGGWGLYVLVGHGPSQKAERLKIEQHHLAHMGYGLLGAIPHTGQYLGYTAGDLTDQISRDINGLKGFRRVLDVNLAELSLASAEPQVHRELETIRLLTVQLERSLIDYQRTSKLAQQQGRAVDRASLEAIIGHPSIERIRRHGDQLIKLDHQLDKRYTAVLGAQQRALLLGVLIWASLLGAAWVLGLALTRRTSDKLFTPLAQLETLMRQSPQLVDAEQLTSQFSQAPHEIASLSTSFRNLLLEVQGLLAQLEDQLRTDALTQVGNRRHFIAMQEQEWKRARRNGEPLSLLLLDVDHFKQYNDHYGHIEGDRCLQQVARAISGQARRSGDVVCRIGGEEFAVLLPATTLNEAAGVALEIVRAIDTLAIEHAGSQVATWVTVSIGVASCRPSASVRPESLMERADGALYVRKKKRGRHGICLADEEPTATVPT